MLMVVLSLIITHGSAKTPTAVIAKQSGTAVVRAAAASSANVTAAVAVTENFRKPYYSFLRVQSQIIGELGKKTLNTRSSNQSVLKQKFEVIRRDYRSLRADVVAPQFDVVKVGNGIRQYRQDFHSYVSAVKTSADQGSALRLDVASTDSTKYLVSAVARSASSVAGKKASDAPQLAMAAGPVALGFSPNTDLNQFKNFNFAALAPSMVMSRGLPAAQSFNASNSTVASAPTDVRSTARVSSDESGTGLTLDGEKPIQTNSHGGSDDKTQAKTEGASEGQAQAKGEGKDKDKDKSKDSASAGTEQANVDKKTDGLDSDALKIDPTSGKNLACLERGNIDSKGNCTTGSTLDKTGDKYVGLSKSYGCSASSGGNNLCDPAFYPSSNGDPVCVSSGKTCKQATREINGNPPEDYIKFLTDNSSTVKAKIDNIHKLCDGQSNSSCQEMLNRANSIEVWMGWGDRYQNVAANNGKKPIPTGIYNAGWLSPTGGAQDAVNASAYNSGSRQ